MIWRHSCLSSSTYWRTWDVSCKLKSMQQMSFRPHHFASFFNRWMGLDLGIALFICLVSISMYFYDFLCISSISDSIAPWSDWTHQRDARTSWSVPWTGGTLDCKMGQGCSYPVHKTTTSLFTWFCQSWIELVWKMHTLLTNPFNEHIGQTFCSFTQA